MLYNYTHLIEFYLFSASRKFDVFLVFYNPFDGSSLDQQFVHTVLRKALELNGYRVFNSDAHYIIGNGNCKTYQCSFSFGSLMSELQACDQTKDYL